MTEAPKRKPYKVLVCGSRDYPDKAEVYRVLDAHYARIGPDLMIISGGARGADWYAIEWALDNHVDLLVKFAKWNLEGKVAGIFRNLRMVAKKPKLVLAFSRDFDKSRGTSHMIKVAEKLNIKVKRFN